MSMTATEIRDLGPIDLLHINPDIAHEERLRILERIHGWERNVRHEQAPLHSVGYHDSSWWYLTDGGDWDINRQMNDGYTFHPLYTIEYILNTKTVPTTHSLWASP
jgi:hypothetical protein